MPSASRLQFGVGAGITGAFVVIAVFAPLIAPYDPSAFSAAPLAVPGAHHWLGANDAGQDLVSQLVYGARASLLVGLWAATLSTAISWTLGLCSGLGRFADSLVTGASDLMLALPLLPLIILVAAYLGASLPVVILTVGAVTWGPFARIIRGQVTAEVRKPYVEAARALGASPVRILVHHVAPATLPIVVAKFVLTVQYAVVVQASLAFLGLGDPSVISWGDMVHRAAQNPLIFLNGSWLWALLPPALAIAILVSGVALIGWSVEERSLPIRLRLHPAGRRSGAEPEGG